MKAVGRAATAVTIAAALFVAGGIGLVASTPRPDADAVIAGTVAPRSALLGPSVGVEPASSSIAVLQERLRGRPDDWRAYASLGLAYVAQARFTSDPSSYPRAEAALRRSLRINDLDNVDAVLGLGVLALARHDFEAALRHGRRAATINPYSADAYGVIGDALLELGRYRPAFEAFQTMVKRRPGLASYARVSYARELLGDTRGAISAMRLAFEAAGTPADAAWAAYHLGELEWGMGDVRAAAWWYRRGLDLAPNDLRNLAGMAKVAWAHGDTDLAIERYSDVVARYPAVEYLTALGDLYATTERPALAERQYAVVRATADLAAANGVNVDLELAQFFADHGEPGRALAAAEAEMELRDTVHTADALAWALHANGRLQEAADASERALRLGTHSAMLLFHAGMIRYELGEAVAARELFGEALDRNPHFSILHAATAERVLARLERDE